MILNRVSELCEAIEVSSGEDANSQVLLASDGKQMNPSELIGAYSVGTVRYSCSVLIVMVCMGLY